MLNLKRHIALVIGATALFIDSVNAHAYMTKPKVEWVSTLNDQTAFVVAIQSKDTGWPGSFNGPPSDNTANFWKGFKTSNYTDIRDLVKDMGKVAVPGATMECGQTDPNGTPQPLPEKIEWTGFTESHQGGCLCACDNVVVFKNENCAANFNTSPAVVPYDVAACVGASRMTFYWMALHGAEWQVYINCAALEGGTNVKTSTSPAETPTAATSPAETPTAATSPAETPTAATSPAKTPSAETSPAETPTAETSPPSAETSPSLAESPATQSDNEKSEEKSKEKCVRRRTRD